MEGGPGIHLREIDLVERCLEGCETAISEVKARCFPYLESALKSYGATTEEAAEIVGTLWLDCVMGPVSRGPLLRKFNGKSFLRNWLTSIAINRWISFKRSESVRERAWALSPQDADDAPGWAVSDPEIATILEEAIRCALAECSSEEVVMLQLVHFHLLSQKEVAALWGWTESKMSRNLNRLQEFLAKDILRRVRRVDENLDICWEDFLHLCDSVTLLQNEV
jgi:RNA polymerase sigma factor (sigma-70 family)